MTTKTLNTLKASTLLLGALTAIACGQEVAHDAYAPGQPTPVDVESSLDTNYSHAPTAPAITAPDFVLARQPIDMTASGAYDPDGDDLEYHWKVRAPWQTTDLIAEGRGTSFSIDAPVPPQIQQIEVEVFARDTHGRRGPSTYTTVEVSPFVIDKELLAFDLLDLCLTNCIVVPQLRDFDFETTLPTTDELLQHYVGVVHDLGYGNYTASVDFTPDYAAITAGAETVFTFGMSADYQPAMNVLLSNNADGSGYAFEVSARVVSLKGNFVTWRWELIELAPTALHQGPGQLSGTVVASGQLSNLEATNTIQATVEGDNLQISFNGLEVVNQPAAATASTQIGFGVHNTAATFNNTSVTLLP